MNVLIQQTYVTPSSYECIDATNKTNNICLFPLTTGATTVIVEDESRFQIIFMEK